MVSRELIQEQTATIIALASDRWDGHWMNRQHLLSRLAARGWTVVYSTGAFAAWQIGSEEWKQAPFFPRLRLLNGVRVVERGKFFVSIGKNGILHRWAIKAHSKILRCQVPHKTPLIAWITHPRYLSYLRHLKSNAVVYHVFDAYSKLPGWTDQMAKNEKQLIEKSNLIITASEGMAKLLGSEAQIKVRVLPNGADIYIYQQGKSCPCPPDLTKIPKPRIGYTGNMSPKFDFNLVASLATQRPDWHFVLVGPIVKGGGDWVDEYTKHGFEKCKHINNIHFLGEKPVTALPAYVGHMDVNAMFYRCSGDGWWKYIYPLKLHEYLAAGPPVVSTPLEAIKPFGDVVFLARDVKEWIVSIEKALSEKPMAQEERFAVAKQNSWEARVNILEEYLKNII